MERDTSFRSWKIHSIKMSILPPMVYILNTIVIKIQVGFPVEIDIHYLEFIWKCQRPSRAKIYWKRTKFES